MMTPARDPKQSSFCYLWEASGRPLGVTWEASGRHLGGIWEASGRHPPKVFPPSHSAALGPPLSTLWAPSGHPWTPLGTVWALPGQHWGPLGRSFGTLWAHLGGHSYHLSKVSPKRSNTSRNVGPFLTSFREGCTCNLTTPAQSKHTFGHDF